MSTDLTALTGLLEEISEALSPVLTQMEWAEDEICKATNRHPDAGDALYHSFKLLAPTRSRMHTEFVYRGHCRELLDRVARCEDTRPGTAAEIVIALCEVSLTVPISGIAVGLLFRMWSEAFPGQAEIDIDRQHREALYGADIDDAEATIRAKLAVPERLLGAIDCAGLHHGERVNCIYCQSSQESDIPWR